MLTDLITEDEIKKIKKNAKHVSSKNIIGKKIPIITPVQLKSGYLVGFSIDEIRQDLKLEHLSISRKGLSVSDPADEEQIVETILGVGYTCVGTMHVKGVTHYMKLMKD